MSLAGIMSKLASNMTTSPATVGSRAALLLSRTTACRPRMPARKISITALRSSKHEGDKQQSQAPVKRQEAPSAPLQRPRPEPTGFGLAPLAADFDLIAPSFGRVGSFLRSIEDEMARMLQAVSTGDVSVVPSEFRESFVPIQVDIKDSEKEIDIKADVPGLTSGDIKVTLDPESNVLTISGEREVEHKETEEGGFTRVERKFGSFIRRFRLPDSVDPDHIKAKVAHGVLHVHIPKAESPPPKHEHEIKVEG